MARKKTKTFHNIFFFSALGILILDQLTKALIRSGLEPGQSLPVIKNILHLTLVHNYGGVFGILQGWNIFFILVTLAVLFIIIKNFKQITKSPALSVLVGVVLGGGLGNLIDRLWFGFVIDFIDLQIWPAFNIADSAITISIIGLVVYFVKRKD